MYSIFVIDSEKDEIKSFRGQVYILVYILNYGVYTSQSAIVESYIIYNRTNFLGGEVPATKLAALQKVLQSEFLNADREVYEHVYETVDVQGTPEIRFDFGALLYKKREGIPVPYLCYSPATETNDVTKAK